MASRLNPEFVQALAQQIEELVGEDPSEEAKVELAGHVTRFLKNVADSSAALKARSSCVPKCKQWEVCINGRCIDVFVPAE